MAYEVRAVFRDGHVEKLTGDFNDTMSLERWRVAIAALRSDLERLEYPALPFGYWQNFGGNPIWVDPGTVISDSPPAGQVSQVPDPPPVTQSQHLEHTTMWFYRIQTPTGVHNTAVEQNPTDYANTIAPYGWTVLEANDRAPAEESPSGSNVIPPGTVKQFDLIDGGAQPAPNTLNTGPIDGAAKSFPWKWVAVTAATYLIFRK